MKRKIITIAISLMLVFTFLPACYGTAEASSSTEISKVKSAAVTGLSVGTWGTNLFIWWNAPKDLKPDGYYIYMSDKKDGKYTKINSTSVTEYCTKTYTEKGETCYFKVKGYKTIGGKKYYTKAKKVKFTDGECELDYFKVEPTSVKNVDKKYGADEKYVYTRQSYAIKNLDTGEICYTFSVPFFDENYYNYSMSKPDYGATKLWDWGPYFAYQVFVSQEQYYNILYNAKTNTTKTFASKYSSFNVPTDFAIIAKTGESGGMSNGVSIASVSFSGKVIKKLVSNNWRAFADWDREYLRIMYAKTSKNDKYSFGNMTYSIYADGISKKITTVKASNILSMDEGVITYVVDEDYNHPKYKKYTLK